MAESYKLAVGSPKLLDVFEDLVSVLTYNLVTTITVTLTITAIVSVVASLTDHRNRLSPLNHAARVTGILVFLFAAVAGITFLCKSSPNLHPIDSRFIFPLTGLVIAAWLLWRATSIFINRIYEPSNWPKVVSNQFALVAGLTIFAFGTLMAHSHSLKGEVNRAISIAPTIENFLYYLIFLASGALVWWVLTLIFRHFARYRPVIVSAIMFVLIFLPLTMILDQPKHSNTYKFNPAARATGRNVVLISIDTLRYDRLGCNFNDYIHTPNIDALAAEGVVFDNCIVPIPLTLPSHCSMLTGLSPRKHRVRVQDYYLAPEFLTLAERLSEDGFTCGGFISMAMMSAAYSKLDQGFHYYDDFWIYEQESRFFPPVVKYLTAGRIINKVLTGRSRAPNRFQRRADAAVDSALKWLDTVKDEDFFCFFHVYDPHWDYNAPEPYTVMYDPDYKGDLTIPSVIGQEILSHKMKITPEDINHVVARYDGEVTYTDAQLGRLFDHLKELGLWDKSMIILTSDHGESFEHDYFFDHALRVYQSCIHVPLIIKPPNKAIGEREDALCSTMDLYPTICEFLGLDPPDDLDGVSLVPFLGTSMTDTPKPHGYLFSESIPFGGGVKYYGLGRLYSIIKGTDKLIYSPYAYPVAPIYQLYDLSTDPNEETNLYGSLPVLSNELINILNIWVVDDEGVAKGASGQIEREALKSLQYLN